MARKYEAMATASTIITDETDASYLTGNLTIINSSRNQIYYTGQSNPYSPDWTRTNLVIRPYLLATNIYKTGDAGRYNPDLFSPAEYRTFDDLSAHSFNTPMISDIHWFIQDTAGVDTEITRSTEGYSFSWTYNIDKNNTITCNDKRQLVINQNILKINSTCEIICKFSFYDPYARMTIPQQFSISLSNIATGEGTNKAVIESLNGTSIYNGTPEYLELEAHYYRSGIEVDLQSEIEDATTSTMIQWYIRDPLNGGWKLLDATTQEIVNDTTDNDGNNYDICKKSYDADTEKETYVITNNAKGGIMLRIYPDLISGSDSIKLVITDGNQNNAKFNDIIVVYDNTDETKAYIHLSNGNKLRRSATNTGTIAKVVITYQGELLTDESVLYNTEFDYYWYIYSFDKDETRNVWPDADSSKPLKYQVVSADDDFTPVKSNRSIYLTYNDITREEQLTVDIVEKSVQTAQQAKEQLLNNLLVSEDEMNEAAALNEELGIDGPEAQIFTANELKANREVQ